MRVDDHLLARQRTLVVAVGPLPGIGWFTHRGDRVPGRRAAWRLRLDADEAAGSIDVAGRRVALHSDERGGAGATTWEWDGLDADGNRMGRSVPVVVTAANGAVRRTSIGRLDARRTGLGGWTPELVHWLDPAARLLHLGDGRTHTRVPVLRVQHDGMPALEVPGDHLRLRFAEDGRHLATIGRTGSRDVTVHWDGQDLEGWDAGGGGTTIRRVTGPDGTTTAELTRGGRTTTLTLDEHGWLRALRSPAGRSVTVGLQEDGLVRRVVSPTGGELLAEHDEDGRLVGRRRPGEGWRRCTEVEVDGARRVVWLSAEGRETRYEVRRATDGAVVRTTTCCGRTAPTVVERRGPTTITTMPGGTTSERTTTPAGQEHQLRLPSGLTIVSQHTAERAADGTRRRTTVVGRDAYVTLIGPDARAATATTPEGRTSRARLDELGRTIRVELPGQPVLTTDHDQWGPTRTQRGEHVLVHRGPEGRADEVEDVTAGHAARFEHDDDDQLMAARLPGERTVRIERDEAGAVVALAPPGRPAHRWRRDEAGRVQAELLPPVDGRTDTTRRTYDGDGFLVRVDRPGGTSRHLELDLAGRPRRVRVVTSDGAETVTTYDRDTTTGRLVRTSVDGLVIEHDWDGPVPVGERTQGSVRATLRRRHDDRGLVVGETVAGREVAFRRDRDGLVIGAGGLRLVRDAATGHVVERWLGIVCEQLERRSDGLPLRRTVWVDQQALVTVRYAWDARGRITEVAVERGDVSHVSSYTYDHADRLATVVEDGVTTHDHRWDANGVRLARFPDDPEPVVADDRDRPVSHGAARITHHPDGRRALRTGPDGCTWTYHHDDLGRLTGIDTPQHQVRHLLDGFGRRVVTTVDGEVRRRLVWGSQRHPAAEVGPDGEVLARFVHAEDRLAPSVVERDGRELLVVCDHVGSVWLVIDGTTGELVQELRYGVWGRVQQDTAPGTQPFGFAGGLVDQTVSLVHFGARDYDPGTGTWTARDPLGFAAGTTNQYAYAEGDPVNRWDPTGTKVERCRALSQIGWQADMGIEHHWIRTDSAEAGVGPHPEPTGGYVLGEGAETAIVDHTGRGDKGGSTCEEVEDVDEDCANRQIATPNVSSSGTRYGKHTGSYLPWNQCQSVVDDILTSCTTREGWEKWMPSPYEVNQDTAVHGEGPMSEEGRDYTPADYTPAEGYGDGEGGEAWE